jgi:RNA polymerase sigma-70 factor (ECF subfamily)
MQAQSQTLHWSAAIHSETDEPELLRQIARGNEEAFGILYERYQGPLYRFAWHMSGDAATAEEIAQEVFMLLIRSPRQFDPKKGSLAGYLFGIARNLTRKSLARTRLAVSLDEQLDEEGESELTFDPADEQQDIFGALSQQQLLAHLQKAILSLPAQYREVIGLCDLEQMSYTDAAELLQCAPGTVASRLHRARALLKSKMGLPGGQR